MTSQVTKNYGIDMYCTEHCLFLTIITLCRRTDGIRAAVGRNAYCMTSFSDVIYHFTDYCQANL